MAIIILLILGFSPVLTFSMSMEIAFKRLCSDMVKFQIRGRGITDERLLSAMFSIPRHLFVPSSLQKLAYEDTPLPIGKEQTISQPYIVALMVDAAKIKPSDKVLEIGTGCGYSAAVISKMAQSVYTIETITELAEEARNRLHDLNLNNIEVRQGDGSLGWDEHAPYDAIIVTAGAPSVPNSLKAQLAINGRLVIPVMKSVFYEHLIRITKKSEDKYEEEFITEVRFVPLIGKEGYPKAKL